MSFYKKVPGRVTTQESALEFDTAPKSGSTNPVTSEGVAKGISDSVATLIDSEREEERHVSIDGDQTFADNYTVGKYYRVGTSITRCTEISNDGAVYTVKFLVLNGIVEALNELAKRIEDLED